MIHTPTHQRVRLEESKDTVVYYKSRKREVKASLMNESVQSEGGKEIEGCCNGDTP